MMPRFAANLTMLYADSPFLDRFARARASGFRSVEFLFPYEYDISAIAAQLEKHGLQVVLFNLPSGNWAAGDRGIAAYPDRVEEFRRGVATAIEVAQRLKCRQVNCLVGKRDEQVPLQDQERVMLENLRYAAGALGEHGISMTMEMLNPFDVPGFLIPTPKQAFAIQDEAGSPNLHVQYDVYHAQRSEGELAATFEKYVSRIAHVQIADNPGRHQPGTGEINYPFLLAHFDKVGYRGYVSLEYIPEGTTEQSLGWIRQYGYSV